MFSLDRWGEVLDTLRRNKLRTALTAISVAWGIIVLVALLGLGNGLNNGMREQFARDAMNGVWIWANKTSVPHGGYDIGRRIQFENRDYEALKAYPEIDHAAGQYYLGGQRWGAQYTKRGSKANSFSINAVHEGAYYLNGHEMKIGRFLSAQDIVERRKAAVIGGVVASFLFAEGEQPIGEWIEVAGVPFQVVGVFTDPSGNEQERQIYIPVSTAQLAFNGSDTLGQLSFTVGELGAAETKAVVDRVVAQLAERHKFAATDSQAVRVQNNVEQFQRFQMMFQVISLFVVLIGIGSLAAGVVGVSNIMMIAVKERTKEIGVRKALGATPRSIIAMIVQEAVFLTGLAGLLGLAAGVGLLELAGALVKTDFVKNPSISLSTGVTATAVLITAGALAGYFPARAAARVNPIHALRDQ
jgi:putative ABC transport system permease protein